MMRAVNPDLDLTISRVIKAPRSVVWSAWTDPASFEQWWVPAPARCKVLAMDLHPGGAFETQISEDGGEFAPHLSGCFLEIVDGERITFTNALLGGWRPAEHPFMTAIIALQEHPQGTEYVAHVMHKNDVDRSMHEKMGFTDGWGTVMEQLANLAEQRARSPARP
ncbi:MAG TPA: SRPBCC family protein [Thermomicrobiales bacterium]|nr:SRPBCC family protein [Thermomicrobiales bacterium]